MQAPDQTSPSYDFYRADVNAIAADYDARARAREKKEEQERKSGGGIRKFLRNAGNAHDDDAIV
jgi:hypothetical protein